MPMTHEDAARALGMRVREIVAVDPRDDERGGYPVTLHDGTTALVTDELVAEVHVSGVAPLSEPARGLSTVEVHQWAKPSGQDTGPGAVLAALVRLAAETRGNSLELSTADQDDPGTEGQGTAADEGEGADAIEGQAAEQVPDGSAEQVLAWVGDDHDRARHALAVEGDRDGDPRAGLSTKLVALLDGTGGGAQQ